MNWLEQHITLQPYDDHKAEMENAWTHFFGAFLSLIGLVIILTRLPRMNASLRLGALIFAFSNILLYSASGMYHYLRRNNWKRFCRILDHSNIYFLIAGTYTPLLLSIPGKETRYLTLMLWLIAALGVCFTLFFWGKLKPLHPVLYLLMGWIIVFFWNDVVPFLPHQLLTYVFGGGVTYSLGVIFYACKKIPHYHAIWHAFVLGGSIWFYIGFLRYLFI